MGQSTATQDEMAELQDIFDKATEKEETDIQKVAKALGEDPPSAPEKAPKGKSTQYATTDGLNYFLCSTTVKKLPPGLYCFYVTNEHGPCYQRMPFNTEALVNFPDTNIDKVVTEIERFWGLEKHFTSHSLTFKRGIILWGPPGSGKSCA